jgi:ATP-dependent Clp protease adapter protein ClpS
MNSTSGSDTRQGFNTAVTMNTWLQKIVLYDVQLMADFNTMMGYKNWDVQFFIDDITHTTINQQESGIVPTDKPQ